LSTSSSERRPPLWILVSALLAVAFAANILLFNAYRQRNMQGYLAAFIDKETLLQNTPSPRIILVGGSSVAFGYDSRALSEQLGMPVVNMGLQGGLGIRFQLESLKPYLAKGDILILSPEYHNIHTLLANGDLLTQMLLTYPQGVRYLSSGHEVLEIARSLPSVHTSAIRNMVEDFYNRGCYLCTSTEKVYYRSAFDAKTGDITTNNDPNLVKAVVDPSIPAIDRRALEQNISYMNAFYREMQGRGVQLFFSYPSIIATGNPAITQQLAATEEILRTELEIPILDTPFDSEYAPELMFDTYYHLGVEGRAVRTRQLIENLCRVGLVLNCQP